MPKTPYMKMPNLAGLFAPPKDAVLSLEVQARMGEVQQEERTQLALLVRHFMDRFFNNEMVSQDGEAKARTIQIAYAIALPGLIFALYLFPPYHYPGGRPFWPGTGGWLASNFRYPGTNRSSKPSWS